MTVLTFRPQQGAFSVRVNTTDPIWLYCGFGRHCQGGQVMVVNPPASGNTLEAYAQAAGSSGNSQNPANVQGGILGEASAFPADSGSSPSSGGSSTGTATATSASGSSTASSTAAVTTESNAAKKIGVLGVAGFAGLFAAFLA